MAVIGVACALVGVVLVRWVTQDNSDVIPEQLPGVQRFDVPAGSGEHTDQPVRYAQTPPVGGPHDKRWQTCGFYSGPVRNEHAVHSLEHGAVWVTYRPPLSEADRQVLTELVRSNDYVLVSAYPGLPAPIVVSAWRHQLRLDRLDRTRIEAFVRVFAGGTTAPEPIGRCTNGVGAPDAS